MNAAEAIKIHRQWKERFYIAMQKRAQLNIAEVSADNCCEFGKWLYGEAQGMYGHLASYQTCVGAHAAFHEEAGKIAQDINDGDFLKANKILLAFDSPYSKASGTLNVGVVALFDEIAKTSNT